MIQDLDIVTRLKIRAQIRRQISSRKSVQEGKPDRIADLLEEAADEIESYRAIIADTKSCTQYANKFETFWQSLKVKLKKFTSEC